MKSCFLIFGLIAHLFAAQPDTAVVATVGPYPISAGELLTSFEFGPAFVKRTNDPLREHLKYMTFECLLALEGKNHNLDESEFVKQRVHGLEEDNAVEHLYRQEILSQVKLSPLQIEQDIEKAKRKITFRWIFASSSESAKRIYGRIMSQHSFDSLFALQIDSAVTPGNRSQETTQLNLERDNPDLAAAMKGLNPGRVSKPVQGKDGWYIVHLDSLWFAPITTQTEYAELKNQAVETRRKIEADKLADQYIKDLMDQNYPVIKAEGFNILRAYLADKGLSHDTKVTWKIPSTFMTEAGPQPISGSGKYLGRTLVTFGKRSLQVRDYVDWYDIRQFQLDTKSEGAFTSSVKKTIWKMVQDKLLSERAYARGLNRIPAVIGETNQWERKLLYLAERSKLLRTIDLSETNIRSYYQKNEKRYRRADGTAAKFSEIKNSVKTDYYYSEEASVLMKAIDELKKKYPVSIDELLLNRLSSGVRRDSHSIDAVIYKPGGTFPHVAFPTIDEAWSRIR